MNILVAHPGTQHAHHLVSGLIAAGEKVNYNTILSFGSNSRWKHLLPGSLFNKRSLKTIGDEVIERYPLLEPIPQLLRAFNVEDHRSFGIRNRMFQKRLSMRAIRNSSAVIGYDSSSVILARKANKAGVPFCLELTTPHPLEKQKWLDYVHTSFPEWPSNVLKKPKDLIDDEEEEVRLATIVSAPSKYVRDSHQRHSGNQKKMVINPFGADVSEFRPKTSYNKTRPRFVFMGAINAAKGLPVLLEAWRLAKPDATLVIAGVGELPSGVKLPGDTEFVGRIQKHEREQFMHAADVFVCPSLYEGLALVQLEAAACGLPLIGTHNSGGSEFLEEGKEGYFVEAGNVNALAEKIDKLAGDPALRESMGLSAAAKAKYYTWDAYVQRWLDVLRNQLSL